MSSAEDLKFLRIALEEAKKCIPTSAAFCVGCVIVDPSSQTIISKGYSRERPGNTHAEENALTKLFESPDFKDGLIGLDMYSTMEPCSERLSGNKPCVVRILEANGLIQRVVLGVREPDTFVRCVGVEKLQENGIIVERNVDPELESECLEVGKRGHPE